MSDIPSMGAGQAASSMGRDPRKCAGHRSDGELCEKWAIKGMRVCRTHGGSAPQVRAAAERRLAEAEVRMLFEKLVPEVVPVENPLEAYARFAGRVMGWLDLMEQLLTDLESPRYRGATAEQVRGEVLLYERAMDRANAVLSSYAKLNIDERLVRLSQAQADLLVTVIKAGLSAAGVTPVQRELAHAEIARQLRLVKSVERGEVGA